MKVLSQDEAFDIWNGVLSLVFISYRKICFFACSDPRQAPSVYTRDAKMGAEGHGIAMAEAFGRSHQLLGSRSPTPTESLA